MLKPILSHIASLFRNPTAQEHADALLERTRVELIDLEATKDRVDSAVAGHKERIRRLESQRQRRPAQEP